MKLSIRNGLVAVFAVLLSGACTSGPDYREPETPVAERFADSPAGATDETPIDRWWTTFEDPELDRLIAAVLEKNRDIAAAVERVRAARALYGVAEAIDAPRSDASAGIERRTRSLEAPFAGPREFAPRSDELFLAGFDASWEIDVFGGARREREAAAAGIDRIEAELADVKRSLAAEAARLWFERIGVLRRIDVLRRSAASQDETRRLTESLVAAGMGTDADARLAAAAHRATTAEEPSLEAEVARIDAALTALKGEDPVAERLARSASPRSEWAPPEAPKIPTAIALGVPSDILRRRPDIVAAERSLAAQTAKIGVATAELFPRIVISGRITTEAASPGAVLTGQSFAGGIGPSISWNLFDGGQARARIAAAGHDAAAALHVYESTVLAAFAETQSAIVAFENAEIERRRWESADLDARASRDIYAARHASGLEDFLRVLIADREVFAIEKSLRVAETTTATRLVALFKSLGGATGDSGSGHLP